MNYDVPLSINLLRLGGDYSNETVVRFSIASPGGDRVHDYYCIGDVEEDDVIAMLTTTLNRYIDFGGPSDDIPRDMGLVRQDDLDEEVIASDDFTPIDFGWCVMGSILSFEMLPREDVALEALYSDEQIQQVENALVEEGLGLKEAMLFTENEFTDWQALTICKAYREGVDDRCIRDIADPKFNHAQMRELARISKLSGYGTFAYSQCLHEDYSVSMLRQVRKMLSYHERVPLWWQLDAEQLREANYAASVGIPEDMMRLYTTGDYRAQSMACITAALLDGMEKEQVAYLLNPAFDAEQIWCIYSGLSKGLRPMQLEVLADASKPAPMMKVVLYAFSRYDLNVATVQSFTDSKYTPQQATVILDAAALRDDAGARLFDNKALFMIADPALTPQQMQFLTASLECGMPLSVAENVKGHLATSKAGSEKGQEGLHGEAAAARTAADRLSADAPRADLAPEPEHE